MFPPSNDCAKEFLRPRIRRQEKLTRRDRFLAEIDSVTPWSKLHKLIEPFYAKAEGAGHPPIGLMRMLRMYMGQRCPEMRQAKKGIDWHSGMKAHVGVDAASCLVHTVVGTAGNVYNVTQAHAPLHVDETAALFRHRARV